MYEVICPELLQREYLTEKFLYLTKENINRMSDDLKQMVLKQGCGLLRE